MTPFLKKKDTPGQEDHPEKEGYKGILQRGNGSTRGSSKPKWVKFWDVHAPILTVFCVQDHHGHAPQSRKSGAHP